MTETAQRATLVLPATGAFEKSGTTINLAGDLLPVNASLQAPEFVRSDFEMLADLAAQLGVPLPPTPELERRVILAATSEPRDFALGDERFILRQAQDDSNNKGNTPILSGAERGCTIRRSQG